MPLPLIPLLLAAAAGFGLAYIAFFGWDDLVNWFQSRHNLKTSDRDHIAFTIQQNLKDGQFKTVQGIFNKRTSQLVDARNVDSKDVSAEQKEHHRKDELVVYQ